MIDNCHCGTSFHTSRPSSSSHVHRHRRDAAQRPGREGNLQYPRPRCGMIQLTRYEHARSLLRIVCWRPAPFCDRWSLVTPSSKFPVVRHHQGLEWVYTCLHLTVQKPRRLWPVVSAPRAGGTRWASWCAGLASSGGGPAPPPRLGRPVEPLSRTMAPAARLECIACRASRTMQASCLFRWVWYLVDVQGMAATPCRVLSRVVLIVTVTF